ncbi:ABC transporter permease subunit [Anaerocolumna sedimenticola]|uniref:ABC transporter permease subunit n=1 Tax=Anaerocolumna sedimenticola TaxID=2696063 RepID=A0A6P1TKG3_9FIRM|nr:ABC transporter permease subunit [Anaerocolumna sedimenticola]QHQ59778.1 ABC transporter permease subunit [Anaerocolumna sedimenticola]
MKTSKYLKKVVRYRFIYLMLLPIIAYFLVFSYYPLALGIFNSFQQVKILGGSEFIGFENYINIVKNPLYLKALWNSLSVGIGTFLLQFVWGLLIALLLNELNNKGLKSLLQTATYIPNILSWAVVGGLWITILSPAGLVNGVLKMTQGDVFRPVVFMAEPAFAKVIMIFTGGWKGAGYYAALFLAAIVSIDPNIYEAASIDGASRLKQMMKITIPNIVPTMKVITVLAAMGVLRNFDQIYVMANSSILDEVRNLLYLIFNDGVIQFKIGLATSAATLVLLTTMLISFTVRKLIRYDDTYND